MSNQRNRYRSDLISEHARQNTKSYQSANTKARAQNDFFNRSMSIQDIVFAPEGYEGLMLTIYFATIPYLMGLLFLFFYVAKSEFEYFVEMSLTSIFVIWAIGYEVCAGLIISFIVLAWVKSLGRKDTVAQRGKRR